MDDDVLDAFFGVAAGVDEDPDESEPVDPEPDDCEPDDPEPDDCEPDDPDDGSEEAVLAAPAPAESEESDEPPSVAAAEPDAAPLAALAAARESVL